MNNVGFRIRQNWTRPAQDLLAQFCGIPVANIADCMNRLPCLDQALVPLNTTPMLGTAFPVRVPSGDNLMFHKALDMAEPGDIIVIAGGGTTERAYCGEIMASYAQYRGLKGFVIDGSIRDRRELEAMHFPIYARGATPNGPYKNGPGEIGYPVSVGGQVIRPGDILIGDSDGVVVIRPEEAAQIAAAARAVLNKETTVLENIAALDRSWIDRTLEEKGVELVP